MSKHLLREMDGIKKQLLALSALVEEHVQKAVWAVSNRADELAIEVINTDHQVDGLEIDVEEDCLKILALHQPVATDLRFIVAVLKINNDLERIGDLAVNIAERALFLMRQEPLDIPFDLAGMSDKAKSMLRHALDSLIEMDANLARDVCARDDEVDGIYRQMYGKVAAGARTDPAAIERLLHLLSISRHLERIADHATNIAEDVIYMIDGEIVRHRVETYVPKGD